MMTLTQGQDEGDMMKTIMRRIASNDDPEHMQELALLAIDMMLKRAEDKPLRNLLIWRVHIAISGLLNEGTLTVDPERRRAAAQNCAELLQTAREQRQPRRVLSADERPADEVEPAKGKPLMSWPLLIAIALGLVVLIMALFALASPAAFSQAAVTATNLAAQIEAAPGVGTMRPNQDGTRFYLARGQDDHPIVVAQDVPRRVCGATGLLLAQDGKVTINGTALSQSSSVVAAALCYKRSGNATLTWSPVSGN